MKFHDQDSSEQAVQRRQLLRGGAVLAGAAGVAVAGAALATPAQAADPNDMVLGQDNEATSPTNLRIGGESGGADPALGLTNANGPSLYLNPLAAEWDGSLDTGQIANTVDGPLIGVGEGPDTITTPLLTEQNVWLPFILPTPERLVDTRIPDGRNRVTLPSPLASDGRLPAGRAMTFWIAPADQGFGIPAVHLNITVVGPTSSGWVVAYPGPDRPPTSTVNFQKGQTLANGAFIGTSTQTVTVLLDPDEPPVEVEAFVMSLYTTAAAWIVVDGTGAYATGFNPIEQQQNARRDPRRASPAARAQRAFGKL